VAHKWLTMSQWLRSEALDVLNEALGLFYLTAIILAVMFTLPLFSDRLTGGGFASHEGAYVEVKQHYTLSAYSLSMELVPGRNATRCDPHSVAQSLVGREEFEQCSVSRYSDNAKFCNCKASYAWLVDHSNEEAAAVWRDFIAGSGAIHASIGVVTLLMLAAIVPYGLSVHRKWNHGLSSSPWNVVTFSIYTVAIPIPIIGHFWWWSFTSHPWCFDSESGSLHGAACDQTLGTLWMGIISPACVIGMATWSFCFPVPPKAARQAAAGNGASAQYAAVPTSSDDASLPNPQDG